MRLTNASLDDVAVFTHVVQQGSFTAAAKALGLPKSTVSRRVQKLEDELGVRLLQRTTRKLRLTDAGRVFFDRGARVVAELEEALSEVSALSEAPRGRLRVTAPVELGADRLIPVVSEYLVRYPEVQLELDLSSRIVDLVAEGYDLAIRAGHLPDSTLVARKLSESPHVLVASPAYLERRGRPGAIEALTEHCCLGVSTASGPAWSLRSARGPVEVRPNVRFVANHFEAVRRACLDGVGLALVPEFMVCVDVAAGRLERVLPDVCGPEGAVYVVYPSAQHLAPKVRAFVDLLVERLGSLD